MKQENPVTMMFTIKKYLLLCLRSWWLFLLCMAFTTSVVLAYLYLKKPMVEVEAMLMLKEDSGGPGFVLSEIASSLPMGGLFGGSSSTDNEASVIASHTVMLRTVKDMGLNEMYAERMGFLRTYPTPVKHALKIKAPEGMADTLSRAITFTVKRAEGGRFDINAKIKKVFDIDYENVSLPYEVKTPYGDFTIEATQWLKHTQSKKFKITYMSYAAAAETYARLINVYVPDRKTDNIGITYLSPNGKFGEDLLNTVIANYIDVANQYKTMRNEQSLNLIDNRLELLQDDLRKSESDLEKFKKEHGLTDVEVDAQYLMTKTGALEASLLDAQTKYEVASMTKDFIANPANKYKMIPDLFASAGMQGGAEGASSQIAKYNELLMQRMQLVTSARPGSQPLAILDEQIEAMHTSIVSTINRIYDNASVALKDIKDETGTTKSRISELPSIERGYLVLKRDNLLQEKMYLFLLQQREELRMSLDTRSLPAQVIDAPHALAIDTSLPKWMLLFIGLVLGFIMAAVIVFMVFMKTAKYLSVGEIEAESDAPVLGALGHDRNASKALAVNGDDPNAETIRQLRSEVQLALKSCEGNLVLVTSLSDNEGKTYTAVNLAASLAKLGKKTLLIDAALRKPTASVLLGIKKFVPALAQYVYSNMKSEDVAIVDEPIDEYNVLSVITAGDTTINPADILGSTRFSELISDLKKTYEYIVIDSTRIVGYSDVTYLTELSDLTLIVCRAHKVSPADISTINKYYKDGRLKRIALVTNGF